LCRHFALKTVHTSEIRGIHHIANHFLRL
jgi:hypothetical protein